MVMKRIYTIGLVLMCCCVSLFAQRKQCIDRDWMFMLGDGSGAIKDVSLTDGWRKLDLPHDWSVEPDAARMAGGTVIGPFSSNSIGKYQTGHTVGGEGWYFKKLTVSDLSSNRYMLYFEGAYNHTEVYLNGKKLYFNPYGYMSFRFDVSDELKEGDNDLLVRVLNEGNNSRWYAGSGIYRHVWLLKTPLLYSDDWDLFIQPTMSEVKVSSKVYNDASADKNGSFVVEILDSDGKLVATGSEDISVKSYSEETVELTLPISGVKEWSPESPYLYNAVVKVIDKLDGSADQIVKKIGFRTMQFSADKGFLLNGKNTLLYGGCVHHDNGLLGSAAYDRAETRKLALLKNQGYNAVRCSHNLPSEHFLDACDSLGLMVIDESFDQWLLQKNTDDYHNFFEEFSDRDLSVMLRRDRNHPSIIMWSFGNEIPGRIEERGLAAAARMRNTIRAFDQSRPITAAICGWDAGDAWNSAGGDWSAQDNNAFKSLDIGGYNYLYGLYERDHGTHPDRVMAGLESFPKQASENWNMVERLPYVIGDFVWTAVDYLGEAGIGSADENNNPSMFRDWPWFNGWCGDIDLIGQKKPQSYYRDVVWRQAPVTMAVQATSSHNSAWGWQLEEQKWTWPGYEGKTVSINVYSRAPKVRLYLNGVSQGDQVPGGTYWTGYYIPYQPGTLKVVNLDSSGKEIAGETFELQTTGSSVGLRLVADRDQINADGADLSYVTIELVDAEGRVVTSDSQTKVSITAEGDGTLLASGNASPTDMESFRNPNPTLFRGRALAILKSTDKSGEIKLTVRSAGLPDASVVVKTVKVDDPSVDIAYVDNIDRIYSTDYFTLQGLRVTRPTKGIYIYQGKKILVR